MVKFYSCVKHLMLAGAFLGMGTVYAARTDAAGVEILLQDQKSTVNGKVVDVSGQPVIGATVLIKGTTNGSITGVDGSFSVDVKRGDVIEVSFIGYKTAEIVYEGQPSLDITLNEDALNVEEVVVTSMGIKRDTKALGYAIQEVNGDALVQSRDVNVTNALSGKVAGLQVVRGGGSTGSSKIILRGQTSLTGSNQPLIVVDGVPMDNFVGGNTDIWGNQGMDMGNGLADLNPEDIESMSVLKGGSAAALYGSRAGNGVILITTKQGKVNKGLGITVSAGVSIENILVKPELQNNFSQGNRGALDVLTSSNSWGAPIDGRQYTNWAGQQENLQAYDNISNFFRTGIIDNESVTFQQQINKTSVYSSITRMHDKSMVPGTNLDRISISSRATTNLGEGDKWKLDVKANYINSKAQNRPLQGINNSNMFYTMDLFPRSLDIRQFKDAVNSSGEMIWWDPTSQNDNPWWSTRYALNNDTRNRLMGFMSLSYQFTDWLSLEGRGGLDYYSTRTYGKKYAGGHSTPKGSYSEGMNDFMEQNYSFLFIARKDNLFGKFGGFVTFGGNMMLQNTSSISGSTVDLIVPNIFSLGNGADKPSVSSESKQRRMNSLYGSLQINYDQAIFVDATLRNDWSSTMSKANRSYLYPSVSVSAVISELVNMPYWFSFAKVRGSFAEVGNDLDPWQLYTSYSVGKDFWGNPTANRDNVLYDPNVRSELVKSWEVGADLRFLRNRFKLDFTWYRSNATRQLINLPMDPSSGYASRKINAGNIQNQGIELTVGANIFNTPKGFIWDASLNFSRNVNKIMELAEGVKEYPLASVDVLKVVAPVGGYYGEIYGSKFARITEKDIAESNGTLPSEALGQLYLDGTGLPLSVGEQLLGNQQPKFLLGFNSSFSYKNVTLDFLIDARVGGKMYSLTSRALHASGNAKATVADGKRDKFVVSGYYKDASDDSGKTWVKNDKEVEHQDYWGRLTGGNTGINEAFLYDATSVRLRTLSLGYDMPKKVLQNTPIQRLRFSVTANNLWLMYTALPGIDPESVSGTGTNVSALELGVPPTSRSFTFNVTIGF